MEFFKVLWDNLVRGPVTEPFPLGEAPTPPRFRGKVKIDPALCVGCGICRHVCTAGAINISARPDNSGYDIVIWHNSCCLCGQCRHYCPTKAATLSNDWHNVHRSDKTFTWVEHQFVPYQTCAQCGALQRFLPPALAEKLYADMPEFDNLPRFDNLCVKCRMIAVAVAEDRACHLTPSDQSDKAPETADDASPSSPSTVTPAESGKEQNHD